MRLIRISDKNHDALRTKSFHNNTSIQGELDAILSSNLNTQTTPTGE